MCTTASQPIKGKISIGRILKKKETIFMNLNKTIYLLNLRCNGGLF
jgi:hypothetical protein